MFFRDIPFRTREKELLLAQVDQNKIPHAQLLLGGEGSGNLALALAFISYLFCTDRMGGDSCGKCDACRQTHKLTHPDIHFSFPVLKKGDKKREDTISQDFINEWRDAVLSDPFLSLSTWVDAMGDSTGKPNINTKECHEIIHNLSLRSFFGGMKVQVIWLAEFLGKDGNRLLKLIEEPSAGTLIILIAERQDKILNTILSRCHKFVLPPYSETEVIQYLKSQYALDGGKLLQIARLSQGNIYKARQLLAGLEKDYSTRLFDWLRKSYKGDSQELITFVGDFASWSMDEQLQFLNYATHFFREFLFWITTDMTAANFSEQEIGVAERLKKILDLDKIQQVVDRIDHCVMAINRNANVKILMTSESIKIGDILKVGNNNFHHYTLNY